MYFLKRNRLTDTENKLTGCQRGEQGVEGDKLAVPDKYIHITVYKIDKQGPTYSTENYIQCIVITYNGKEY